MYVGKENKKMIDFFETLPRICEPISFTNVSTRVVTIIDDGNGGGKIIFKISKRDSYIIVDIVIITIIRVFYVRLAQQPETR